MVRCTVQQDKVEPTSCLLHPTATGMTVPGLFTPAEGGGAAQPRELPTFESGHEGGIAWCPLLRPGDLDPW